MWPVPWRASRATFTPSTWVTTTFPDGGPKGVSTSTASPAPMAPSASPSPDPPMIPTTTSFMATPRRRILATAARDRLRALEETHSRSPGLPEEGHHLLRHHHAAQGQDRVRHP